MNMMYLAEFVFKNSTDLVSELLVQTDSVSEATKYAQEYAENWGLELFSLTPATEKQTRLYQIGKTLTVKVA